MKRKLNFQFWKIKILTETRHIIDELFLTYHSNSMLYYHRFLLLSHIALSLISTFWNPLNAKNVSIFGYDLKITRINA